MKGIGYPVNVIKDTNRLVGSTQTDFGVVRPGSFVRIGTDNFCYTVAKTNKIFYIKDFKVTNERIITIKDNVGINLIKDDVLTISYKEYELLTLIEIKDGGSRYKVGDLIYVEGGDLAWEVQNNVSRPVQFEVTEVDERGAVKMLGLKDVGLYINPPPKICNTYTHQSNGTNLVLELEYKPKDDRRLVERVVKSVDNDTQEADLFLDYPLPSTLKEGKLSLTKWEILLTSNYVGDSRVGVHCEICRDFTTWLGLPLINRGDFSLELSLNQAFTLIDQYWRQSDEEIEKLQKSAQKSDKKIKQLTRIIKNLIKKSKEKP